MSVYWTHGLAVSSHEVSRASDDYLLARGHWGHCGVPITIAFISNSLRAELEVMDEGTPTR